MIKDGYRNAVIEELDLANLNFNYEYFCTFIQLCFNHGPCEGNRFRAINYVGYIHPCPIIL